MNRPVRCLITMLVPILSTISPSFVRGEFQIKQDDRVVFWGDSITDNAPYPRTIENYVRGRYPNLKVNFWNLGWGGDAATTKRIERDLPPLQPTLVLIDLGMNDGAYAPFSEEVTTRYLNGISNLISVIRSKTQARIILITPTTYETGIHSDEPGKKLDGFYPDTLRKMSQRLIAFGAEKNIPVIDLNAGYSSALAKYKAADPALRFSPDGVHPNATGQALMAYVILQGLGADGDILNLHLDAQSGKVADAANQTISDFARTDTGFSLVRHVSAFPFKTSGNATLPDQVTWQAALNRNTLQVSGLSAPYYALYLGDTQHPLCTFSNEELTRGVNLADYDLGLPEDAMSAMIASNVEEMQDNRYTRWRRVLLRGVSSPYVNPPFHPETSQSLLLAAKADTIASFLSSDKVFCSPYTLLFTACQTPDVAFNGPAQSMLLLDDEKRSLVTASSAAAGELRVSTDHHAKTYNLAYSYTNTWWASIFLSVNDPQSAGPIDISGYTAMQFVYRGLEGGQTLSLVLGSGPKPDDAKSTNLDAGGSAATWTLVEIPLERLRTGKFDPAKLSSITFGATGTPSGKGNLSVKSIRFIKR